MRKRRIKRRRSSCLGPIRASGRSHLWHWSTRSGMSDVFDARKKWSHLSGSILWKKARAKREGWARSANTVHGLCVICLDKQPKLAATRRSDSSILRLAAGEAAQKQRLQRPGSFSLTVTSCFVMVSVTRNSAGGAKLACTRGQESWAVKRRQSLEV